MITFDQVDSRYKRLLQGDWDEIQSNASGSYVEVGTNHGASALAASEAPTSKVVTIDIFDWQPKVYGDNPKITFFKGTAVDYASVLVKSGELIDTLFIDGAHEYEYVQMDCRALCPLVRPGGTIMFHDHNPNNPITRVYEAINDYLQDLPHEAFPKGPGTSNLLRIKKL